MTLQFTLRQLEYVVAVARHLNFGEAARSCHVSQPSLSAQVSHLEGVLGEKLFERGPRGVSLSPFGAELIPIARRVLEESGRLEERAKAEREPLSGEIHLGVIPTVAPFLLPPLMKKLREKYPKARVLLRESPTSELVERIASGELDVALLALEADLGTLQTKAVFEDYFVVALPAGHSLASQTSIGLADLPLEELLLLEEGHCLSRQVIDVCGLSSNSTGSDFRASSLVTLVEMVSTGIGITLLPAVAQDSELVTRSGVVLRPLTDKAYRTIGLAFRKGSTRIAEFDALALLMSSDELN